MPYVFLDATKTSSLASVSGDLGAAERLYTGVYHEKWPSWARIDPQDSQLVALHSMQAAAPPLNLSFSRMADKTRRSACR